MPELPEVEHARGLLESRLVGRRIQDAHVAEDDIVFEGKTPKEVRAKLVGRTILSAERHGKVHWLTLDTAPHPVFRLGMTGGWRFEGDEPMPLDASAAAVDRTWPPKFTKLRIVVDDGEMALTNARRLGRVLLRASVRDEPPVSELGFDPFASMPSPAAFVAQTKGRRGNVKALLMDQSFSAGVGNWIADEVLYQAAIDPRRKVDALSPEELLRLRAQLEAIVRLAVEVDARKELFPKGWLFHRRWGKKPAAKTLDGEVIERIKVAGRTTAWVPTRQH